uniref:Glycoside hydrolase n=2 Tax=Tetraselmis sp. GSL018 TaxID=582737 RepID=A0A061RWZ9_9CHLO
MTSELHRMGFKVMLWVTPFVSPDSITFRYAEAKNFLVKGPEGETGVCRWWDGYSALLDTLNPNAVRWFEEGLEGLTAIGVDGFKMDGGDPEYFAQITGQGIPESLEYTEAFAALGLRYGLVEYRACWKQAGTHLVQRLCDKNHAWDSSGLASLIPNGIAQGISGYAFGCPDMIGGGQYSDFYEVGTLEPHLDVDQELFVRYAQVSALFPMMQFSLAPWRVLDAEHLEACVEAANLHAELGEHILGLAKHAAETGEPILRCMEYVFPHQGYAEVQDQFMLGSCVLVAPIATRGSAARTVRVPPGSWEGRGAASHLPRVQGPADVEVEAPVGAEGTAVEMTRLIWFSKREE